MKLASPILFLAMTLNAYALISSNLVADWQAGVGVTTVGGQISQWNDQHQLLNNDGITNNLTQTSATYQPYDMTDAQGYRGVMFPWAYGSAHPNDYLNIPNTLTGLNTTNLTVYVVATGPIDQERSETLIWFSGSSGWIRFFLAGTYPAYYPTSLSVGSQTSTLYPPLNRAVFIGSGNNVTTTLRWNNVTSTNAPQTATAFVNGGTVAVNNSAISGGSEYGYSGIIYRILVYKAAHTAAQMDAQVSELSVLYGVLTNYTKQAVCRGDSITEGVDSTMLQNYPFQLCERYPEIKWRNQGIGGLKIGTNADAGTMYVIDGNFVDPLYDGTLQQNWLLFFGGVNDMNSDNLTGALTYGRLTNYVAARKAARPWTVIVSTVQATIQSSGHPEKNAQYNSCIRTNAGGWDGYVDPGLNSPIETRLDDYTNTNYFDSDGLHLINAGYAVFADHFGQIVNVPHRTTGFFGP
jgi:lysophospholipase L1-like esterase